jgi:hypothetical protein
MSTHISQSFIAQVAAVVFSILHAAFESSDNPVEFSTRVSDIEGLLAGAKDLSSSRRLTLASMCQ